MFHLELIGFLVIYASAVVADDPIINLKQDCPVSYRGQAQLLLTADVPAYAAAKCKNGKKKFVSTSKVHYQLVGMFDQSYSGGSDCLFYKKNGSNTFTVHVEVGWGEKNSEVIRREESHTISCAYDDYGNALSSSDTIADGFIAPEEIQNLVGGKSTTATFDLKVLDVLDREISTDHISIGRKLRLRATDTANSITAFRALSCVAENAITSYAILRAGCGDGLVFGKSSGFKSDGEVVYSPYFDAFKLQGGDTIQFRCNFTVCSALCNGDSCLSEVRRRRAASDLHTLPASSRAIHLKPLS